MLAFSVTSHIMLEQLSSLHEAVRYATNDNSENKHRCLCFGGFILWYLELKLLSSYYNKGTKILLGRSFNNVSSLKIVNIFNLAVSEIPRKHVKLYFGYD